MYKKTYKTDKSKKAVLEALITTHGIISKACDIANINRANFYEWLKKDADFAEKVEAVTDIAIDYVESKLFENIANNQTAEILFYLKCKGKKRGYIESIGVDHTTNGKDMNNVKLIVHDEKAAENIKKFIESE